MFSPGTQLEVRGQGRACSLKVSYLGHRKTAEGHSAASGLVSSPNRHNNCSFKKKISATGQIMSVVRLNTPNQGQKGHRKNPTVLPAFHEPLPMCNQTLSILAWFRGWMPDDFQILSSSPSLRALLSILGAFLFLESLDHPHFSHYHPIPLPLTPLPLKSQLLALYPQNSSCHNSPLIAKFKGLCLLIFLRSRHIAVLITFSLKPFTTLVAIATPSPSCSSNHAGPSSLSSLLPVHTSIGS